MLHQQPVPNSCKSPRLQQPAAEVLHIQRGKHNGQPTRKAELLRIGNLPGCRPCHQLP